MDKLNGWITVKSYITKQFEVELLQDSNGRYCVRYQYGVDDRYSEWMTDFITASMIFDMKLQELEGH